MLVKGSTWNTFYSGFVQKLGQLNKDFGTVLQDVSLTIFFRNTFSLNEHLLDSNLLSPALI